MWGVGVGGEGDSPFPFSSFLLSRPRKPRLSPQPPKLHRNSVPDIWQGHMWEEGQELLMSQTLHHKYTHDIPTSYMSISHSNAQTRKQAPTSSKPTWHGMATSKRPPGEPRMSHAHDLKRRRNFSYGMEAADVCAGVCVWTSRVFSGL